MTGPVKRLLALSIIGKEADKLRDNFEGQPITDKSLDLFIEHSLENDPPEVAARSIAAVCLLYLEQEQS